MVLRNARRDANKHADHLKGFPEDEIKTLKEEIQDLLKKYEKQADEKITIKTVEVREI